VATATETRLWFGKHRGQPLSSIPSSYLLWALSEVKLTPGIERKVRSELASRPDAPPLPPAKPAAEPSCSKCGRFDLQLYWYQQRDGRKQIKAICPTHGLLAAALPHTPANVQRADAAQPQAGLLDALVLADELGVELVVVGGAIDIQPWQRATVELRRLVKQSQHQLVRHLQNGARV
jgi:hypothetical protein